MISQRLGILGLLKKGTDKAISPIPNTDSIWSQPLVIVIDANGFSDSSIHELMCDSASLSEGSVRDQPVELPKTSSCSKVILGEAESLRKSRPLACAFFIPAFRQNSVAEEHKHRGFESQFEEERLEIYETIVRHGVDETLRTCLYALKVLRSICGEMWSDEIPRGLPCLTVLREDATAQ